MKVVHVNKEPYDVLIGRPSKWGNPFTHIANKSTLAEYVVGSREEALEKYREYLLNNEKLLLDLHELEGKVLGCWCIQDSSNPPYPYVCHGQILLEVLTQMNLKKMLNK